LALRILGPKAIAELQSDSREDSPLSRALRAFLLARSRFAEDELAAAVERGIRQYVILGAGLDTSAFRAPYADRRLRIFEVDHPATQAWKQERLAVGAISVPATLTFVPLDFERQDLAAELSRAGFQFEATFFSWLGVTPYLSRQAFDQTLAWIASLPAPSGVVFDYAVDPSSLNLVEQAALRALAARVESTGEPFRLFFVPSELTRDLYGMGFSPVETLARDQMNGRYFEGRRDSLRITGGLAQLVSARR
jgi:methyltransferase (TIGR00027 family)